MGTKTVRMCKTCGKKPALPGRGWCSLECMDVWDAGLRLSVCPICGVEFYRERGKNKKRYCKSCQWQQQYGQPKTPNRPRKAPKPENRLEEAVRETVRIERETGKRLTYGELMARKQRGDK